MKIIKGKTFGPRRVVAYGPPGVGKSTFACKAEKDGPPSPGVLVLDWERGLEHIGPNRVEGPRTWSACLSLSQEACESKGDWDTVVIDTADALEKILIAETCVKMKKFSVTEGFGGVEAVGMRWRELLNILELARAKGRSVHIVAHVDTVNVKDPTMPKDYRKYIGSLTKFSWLETLRWADAVMFADYDHGVVDGRSVSLGTRSLRTVEGTGYDAKHRPNIAATLPLSWAAYEREFKRYDRTAAQILESIRGKVRALPPGAIKDTDAFVASMNEAIEDVDALVRIECKLEERETKTETKPTSDTIPAPAAGPAPGSP